MLPIKTILHATDFSPQSDCAFRLAGALARDYGAKLVILHVVQSAVIVPMNGRNGVVPVNSEESKARLREKLEKLHPADAKVKVEHCMAEGDPAQEILKAARETMTDLVVLGTHGWTGLARLLMGSVAEGVVRKSPCPVLTVRMPSEAEKTAEKTATLEPATA